MGERVPAAAPSQSACPEPPPNSTYMLGELQKRLSSAGETFSGKLLKMIDESGMTDPQCYHLANLDRRHFSKIRSDPSYRPTKNTALAFAVALRMDADSAEELLRSAGFALNDTGATDIIVKYCLENGIYNIHCVNWMLLSAGEQQLGQPYDKDERMERLLRV